MPRIFPVCFLLCLPLVAQAVPCGNVSVERARFAAEIRDREPLGQPSFDANAMWFFTEVRGAANRVLHHRWLWRDEEVADVALRIGGDQWRTWSSKVLGARHGDEWEVELRLDDGCVLGRYALAEAVTEQNAAPDATTAERQSSHSGQASRSANTSSLDRAEKTAANIRALLESGDITGARLALAEASELNAIERERLAQEVSLGRIEAQVKNDELYLASARLDQLLAQPLTPALQRAARDLKARLESRRRKIDDKTAVALHIWEESRLAATGGLVCVEEQAALQDALRPLKASQHLTIVSLRRTDDQVVAEVLDRRTGLMHRVTQRCFQWRWK